MALKRRLATFISNWVGVIIAIVIVIFSATFGGIYLNARDRITSAAIHVAYSLHFTQDGLYQNETVEEPYGFVYHLILYANNTYENTLVNVVISDIVIRVDDYVFPLSQYGIWEKSVIGSDDNHTTFEGRFIIDKECFDDLVTKGTTIIDIEVQLSSGGRYRWATYNISLQRNIQSIASFKYVDV